ncbi:sigma-70 family RNA polymerase sigma factor [Amycolatopsis suaedae]|uniref:Sigma-70 family RNA polymerase sigma factor n=1 Tax=Amycolatopsis suaedae TaxID=2510978 RepID=A0A4Q7J184_9PSEU|nr:sigma-70 family RNA polymerase sigma factor [Amycolatopsis suaedae]RZQ60587.1 sigma-70 family RNA polymerase sigma factor [Amycolatopsis suaedae]
MTQVAQGLDSRLEQYRVELTGYCYRMLGSGFEAEDATQETLVRAWRGFDGFEGRSSLRAWLYRIATNICLDMLKSGQRRAMPMDTGPAASGDAVLPDAQPGQWLEPVPDHLVLPAGDPAATVVARESIRLAFVAALQHLPPQQRAVLILRDVLAWRAAEVAELLDTTVTSVNSTLQRARATLAKRDTTDGEPLHPGDAEQRELLDRYVAAFERYDMSQLVSLLHDDAKFSMPPLPLWLEGRDDILRFLEKGGCLCPRCAAGDTTGCSTQRLLPTMANGLPAFAVFRANGPGGTWAPAGVEVIGIRDGAVISMHTFLDHRLPALFGCSPPDA